MAWVGGPANQRWVHNARTTHINTITDSATPSLACDKVISIYSWLGLGGGLPVYYL